jgi:selenocysteine insertion sequence-binding protein 2
MERDPIKANMRRRLVVGLRQVARSLRLKEARAIVVAPNIEKSASKGGLDER